MARTNHRQDHRLRATFFEEGQHLDADPATRPDSACWICRGRIDYTAKPGTTPDSHNLDHRHPVSTHPELQRDPANFRHSHTSCNQHRGNSAPSAGLGEQIPDWWS